MNTNINKEYTLPRAIVLVVCPLLLAVACDNYDGPGPDTPVEEVPLNFNASMEKMETTQSRAIIAPTADFTGNSYSFGMSLTKSKNGSGIFKGPSDMIVAIEHPNSSAQWNQYFIGNSGNVTVTPAGPEGKVLKVVAYYPSVLSATKDVYTDGIPFDFSSKTDIEQTDLLHNISTIYPFVPSGDPVATILLNFRHAYTWIVFSIAEYVDKGPGYTSSSASLSNLGSGWIKNRGAADPKIGLAKDGATAGSIGITVAPAAALSTTQVLTYEFLILSFMDTKVSDGDIVLVLNVNEIDELLMLDRIYLDRSDDGKSFGFGQGYKNTYDLVYSNSALSLGIQNWSSEVIDGDFGDNIVPSGNGDYKWMDLNQYYWPSATKPGNPQQTTYSPKVTYLTTGVHPFENYLTTVAYGGNGAYVSVSTPGPTEQPTDGLKITDDIDVYKDEKAYPVVQITGNSISAVPVPWEDTNGQLIAKELCRRCNGGDFRNWRLSRAPKLRAVSVLVSTNGSDPSDLNFGDQNRNRPYQTGTEVNENEAWGMYIGCTGSIADTKLVLSPYDKKMTTPVRCVRDAS